MKRPRSIDTTEEETTGRLQETRRDTDSMSELAALSSPPPSSSSVAQDQVEDTVQQQNDEVQQQQQQHYNQQQAQQQQQPVRFATTALIRLHACYEKASYHHVLHRHYAKQFDTRMVRLLHTINELVNSYAAMRTQQPNMTQTSDAHRSTARTTIDQFASQIPIEATSLMKDTIKVKLNEVEIYKEIYELIDALEKDGLAPSTHHRV
ncbi:hypothetical protein BDB00DRAFT_844402 [Zychaea mexicana]|uniref:uncharacterized protein n=1 Tax=Zychaea mexicana TaxID=64656 RepID=UPI0022FF2F0D|nr:uncharacterized protein BDB00DRAFT_844402 [Zychaea mexicana]KAI9489221.1 hypothetical protein BDB00DRAFT_844402 [Zychaea mexicana]